MNKYGFMVSWFHGFMVSWFHGFMVSWFHGFNYITENISACHYKTQKNLLYQSYGWL